MPTEPVAIIVAGKVENAELLRRYWRDENERRYHLRRGMFADLEQLPVALAGGSTGAPQIFRPRPIDKEIDQLKGQVAYLNNKVLELRAEKKKGRGEY